MEEEEEFNLTEEQSNSLDDKGLTEDYGPESFIESSKAKQVMITL